MSKILKMKIIIDDLNDEAVLSLNPLEYELIKNVFLSKSIKVEKSKGLDLYYKKYFKNETVKKVLSEMIDKMKTIMFRNKFLK